MEIWKDIKGYEGLYQVSNLGRIKGVERYRQNHGKLQKVEEKIKNIRPKSNGYMVVDLYKDNKQKTVLVHRIVAENFICNHEKKQTVNHVDGNVKNNNVENLQWATFREQNIHFYKNNLKSKENIDKAVKAMNEASGRAVICLTTNKTFKCIAEAGRHYNISGSAITRNCKGKSQYCGKLKNGTPLVWEYLD